MPPAPRHRAPALAALLALLLAAPVACGGSDDSTDGAAAGDGSEGTGPDVVVLDPDAPDPRGEVFDAFQAGVDRSGVFTTLDGFCVADREPVSPDGGIAPIVVAVVVTAEDADPTGSEPTLADDTRRFVDAANACGGIRGRPVRLAEVVVDLALRPGETAEDVLRAACLEAVDDVGAAVVLDPVGLAEPFARCLTVERGAVLLTAGSAPVELLAAAGGRLVTLGRSVEAGLADLVAVLDQRALLAGRTIGLVTSEDRAPVVSAALAAALVPLGREVAVTAIVGCTGAVTCDDGIVPAVDELAAADVGILLPVLDPPVLATVLAEAAARGLRLQVHLTALAGQAQQDSLDVVVQAGDEAARLFDGSLLVDWTLPGDPAGVAVVTAFDRLCTTVARPPDGDATLEPDDADRLPVLTACALVRLAARGLEAATGGARPPVPTPTVLAASLGALGPVDVPGMLPAAIDVFDPTAVDVAHVLVVDWPCAVGDDAVCLDETDGYQAR